MYERNSEEKKTSPGGFWHHLGNCQLVEELAIFLVIPHVSSKDWILQKSTLSALASGTFWHSPNLILTYFIIFHSSHQSEKSQFFPSQYHQPSQSSSVCRHGWFCLHATLPGDLCGELAQRELARIRGAKGCTGARCEPGGGATETLGSAVAAAGCDWKLRIYGMLMYIIMLMQKMMINHCSLEHVRIYTWFLDTPINIWTPKNEGKGWNGTYQLHSKFRYMLYTCLSFWRLQKICSVRGTHAWTQKNVFCSWRCVHPFVTGDTLNFEAFPCHIQRS